MFPHPVPPTLTASVDDADQTPFSIVATPVRALESIPVPPLIVDNVPEIVERVVVAVHVGTPFCKARVKPSVVFEMDEREFAVVV